MSGDTRDPSREFNSLPKDVRDTVRGLMMIYRLRDIDICMTEAKAAHKQLLAKLNRLRVSTEVELKKWRERTYR